MNRDFCIKVIASLTLSLTSIVVNAAPSADETRYRDAVVRAAREARVEPALLMAVVKVESNFDARARHPDGPVGLTQITTVTARSVQPGIRQADLLKPEQNLRVGARHLRQLLDEFRDPRMAIAAYQAGVTRVKTTGPRILKHPHTGRHVERVMREYESYRTVHNTQGRVTVAIAAPKPVAKAVIGSKRTIAANRNRASLQAAQTQPRKPVASRTQMLAQNT